MEAAGDREGSALVQAIGILSRRRDLTEDEAAAAVAEIMEGHATPAQTAGFLVALRLKGETETEIAGVARALRERMVPVAAPDGPVIDTCGTGGDGLHTFNISTVVAFVVAGTGVPVAKHGNRSVSSRCGSADVLEELGVPLVADAAQLGRILRQVGLAFLFAPHLHPAMRHAAATRREIGIRTVFNLVGPLVNPAAVRHQLIGVFDPALTGVLARVLGRLGTRRAWVVCGDGGMDELTTTGLNQVATYSDGGCQERSIDATSLGLPRARMEDLAGGDARENARILRAILEGEQGPRRDIVLLNAAAALVVAGTAPDLPAGLIQAAASLDRGEALAVFQRLRGSAPRVDRP